MDARLRARFFARARAELSLCTRLPSVVQCLPSAPPRLPGSVHRFGRVGSDDGEEMSSVVMHSVGSVGGRISDDHDQVGPMFHWYANGDMEPTEDGRSFGAGFGVHVLRSSHGIRAL
jgi:hypothetical protein